MVDIAQSDRAAETSGEVELLLTDPSIKARQRENSIVNVSRGVLALVLLAAWELASGSIISPFWVSSPSGIAMGFVELLNSGQLPIAVLNTVLEAGAGFVAGAILGIALGVIFGVNRIVARVLDPYLVGAYSLPRVALVPLFILWFGIGFEMKVIFTALLVFFPIFMNTLAGVRNVDDDLIDVIRVMGASRWDAITKVFVPSALTWVFAGLRISVPFALIGAVVAEMFSSNQGLGYLISQTANQFNTAGLFATLIVTMVLGLALDATVHFFERRLLRWQRRRH